VTSALKGWPDLSDWTPGSVTLARYGEGSLLAVPSSLSFATRADGTAQFVVVVARQDDRSEPVVSLQLTVLADRAAAPLVPWRTSSIGVTVEDTDASPIRYVSDLEPSVGDAWEAVVALTPDAARLLAQMDVSAPTITIDAVVEIVGVAARADTVVTFRPPELLAAVAGATSRAMLPGALLAASETVSAVRPLDWPIARALADRLVDRFATTPATVLTDTDVIAWKRGNEIAETEVRWDLAEAAPTSRWHRIELSRAEIARALSQPSWLVHRTIPSLDLGDRTIEVRTTVPSTIAGIDSIQVEIAVPPDRSHPRGQSAIVSLCPGPIAPTAFRVAPGTELGYSWRTVSIASDPAAPGPWTGETRSGWGDSLRVRPTDLGVSVVRVGATSGLLTGRTCAVTANDSELTTTKAITAVLTPTNPSVWFGVPTAMVDRFRLDSRLFDDDHAIGIAGPGLPFTHVTFDRNQFAEFGAHTIAVSGPPGVIELIPDDPTSPTPAGLVHLTDAVTTVAWSYVVLDPLRSGYRVRVGPGHTEPGQNGPERTWSEPHPCTEPLTTTESSMASPTFTFNDTKFRRTALPDTWSYVALYADAERTADGHPTITLINIGETGIVQLGTRWEPATDALEALRNHIAVVSGTHASEVRLTPDVRDQVTATLDIRNEAGVSIASVQSTTSNYPPFAAVFNLTVDAVARTSVFSALAGRSGLVSITYRSRVAGEAIEASTDIGNWFPAGGLDRVVMGSAPA
jgi:hypothetical protein